jgi:hypothetical protein
MINMQECEYCGKKMNVEYLGSHLVWCINDTIKDPALKFNEWSNLNWYYIYDNTKHPPHDELYPTIKSTEDCLKSSIDKHKEAAIKFCEVLRQTLMEEINALRQEKFRHDIVDYGVFLAGILNFFNELIRRDCESKIPNIIKNIRIVLSRNRNIIESLQELPLDDIFYFDNLIDQENFL